MTNNRLLSSSTLTGDAVRNRKGEDLGKIEDLMIDVNDGSINYAVLSYGGFLGMGDKLFAVPWSALTVAAGEERLVLDIEEQRLKDAPGFDKNNWPDFADPTFQRSVSDYYAPMR